MNEKTIISVLSKSNNRISTLIILLVILSFISSSSAYIMTSSMMDLSVETESLFADNPECWLVLYNLNSLKSVIWANWYQEQRNIPDENMIGLYASLDEHLPDLTSVQTQIISPVRTLLNENPDLNSTIMGILLGYGLPGHYDTPLYSVGGFSVSDALSDMYDDDLDPYDQQDLNLDNTQIYGPDSENLIPENRLTRDSMQSKKYMVARIDAPSLQDAMDLTLKAKSIEYYESFIYGQKIYYDYEASIQGVDYDWSTLKWAVGDYPSYGIPLPDEPFTVFVSETEQISNDAFRFGWHDVDGWNDGRLNGIPAGKRILAYNQNSWGATTVRSTTEDNARYVPNVLSSGYAAAIGATGEPYYGSGPSPAVLIAALREGWTVAEAFYLAKLQDDWMWTLVGDPFLKVPNWFDETPDLSSTTRMFEYCVLEYFEPEFEV